MIDAVQAFQIARDHVIEHGADYWAPSFWIDLAEGVYTVTTNSHALGSNAEVCIDAESGEVVSAHWNPQ